MSTADLKMAFEVEVKDLPYTKIALKTFSSKFSECIGVRSVKGGPRRDRMGFPVKLVSRK